MIKQKAKNGSLLLLSLLTVLCLCFGIAYAKPQNAHAVELVTVASSFDFGTILSSEELGTGISEQTFKSVPSTFVFYLGYKAKVGGNSKTPPTGGTKSNTLSLKTSAIRFKVENASSISFGFYVGSSGKKISLVYLGTTDVALTSETYASTEGEVKSMSLSGSGTNTLTYNNAGANIANGYYKIVNSENTTFYLFDITIGASATMYPVTYVIGGGATGTAPTQADTNGKITLAAATGLSKTGYIFDGWNDGKNTYAAGEEYTVSAATTLTAQWAQAVTATYNTDGGEMITAATVKTGTSLTLPTPTKTGFVFGSWQVNGIDVTSPYTINTDTTFVATWQAAVTATFDANGGTVVNSIAKVAGESIVLPTTDKTNYIFNGWQVGGIGEVLTGNYILNADTAFVANYTAITVSAIAPLVGETRYLGTIELNSAVSLPTQAQITTQNGTKNADIEWTTSAAEYEFAAAQNYVYLGVVTTAYAFAENVTNSVTYTVTVTDIYDFVMTTPMTSTVNKGTAFALPTVINGTIGETAYSFAPTWNAEANTSYAGVQNISGSYYKGNLNYALTVNPMVVYGYTKEGGRNYINTDTTQWVTGDGVAFDNSATSIGNNENLKSLIMLSVGKAIKVTLPKNTTATIELAAGGSSSKALTFELSGAGITTQSKSITAMYTSAATVTFDAISTTDSEVELSITNSHAKNNSFIDYLHVIVEKDASENYGKDIANGVMAYGEFLGGSLRIANDYSGFRLGYNMSLEGLDIANAFGAVKTDGTSKLDTTDANRLYDIYLTVNITANGVTKSVKTFAENIVMIDNNTIQTNAVLTNLLDETNVSKKIGDTDIYWVDAPMTLTVKVYAKGDKATALYTFTSASRTANDVAVAINTTATDIYRTPTVG